MKRIKFEEKEKMRKDYINKIEQKMKKNGRKG